MRKYSLRRPSIYGLNDIQTFRLDDSTNRNAKPETRKV